ncbi:Non-repetitive/WGA-negative nucleoporin C-terminal-domain-containing protein [Lineolata rhizophorae]|uniref:Non-repetitive/WGA-negative nucleoporin C-terminal-domain-containing protein n=1 Tax=Lineolata rhizophorae TaxID=578093 RepID=A0A6A6NTV8_9PEZI|nr:Non-repetitive/WGA-negative nucleoporin C-terminal-domain-containing protein [Lineolata rhizophorae]
MAAPGTPQRPMPGLYMNTPAPNRHDRGFGGNADQPFRPPVYRAPSGAAGGAAAAGVQNAQQAGQQNSRPSSAGRQTAQSITPVERAARAVNENLTRESRFPELDNYVTQGISSEYDLTTASQAWAPFERVRRFPIPDRIFEQYNRAQVNTMMGLLAEIHHAWISIDNSLYMWDYTNPNPELIGFEEQAYNVTAVRMIKPKKGVFTNRITHLLAIGTTQEITLLGMECKKGPGGVYGVELFQTRMSVPTRGIDVSVIEDGRDGRIFFAGRNSNDVYEMTYQQEERWFQNRCSKICHTSTRLQSVMPSIPFSVRPPHEHVVQMVADDTRSLLYVLSSESTIRVFHMRSEISFDCCITMTFMAIRTSIQHMVARTDLIDPTTDIASIAAISATESSRLNLMIITSTGCRIFMSATSGYYATDATSPPTSMAVHHVKFPPATAANGQPQQRTIQQQPGGPYAANQPIIDTNSRALIVTRRAARFPPGYFFCFVAAHAAAPSDELFLSAPDSGRMARPAEPQQMSRYFETGLWCDLGSRAEDVGVVSEGSGGAEKMPLGFGNEMAIQFDKPIAEIAILTNTGVHTFRRRRLVDVFAAVARRGAGLEGTQDAADTVRFIRRYGRTETTATALAVACGQAVSGGGASTAAGADGRVSGVNDPDVLDFARRVFIEQGGKPTLNENAIMAFGGHANPVENVRPSPRHDGIALYVARLVRRVWKEKVMEEKVIPGGGLEVKSTVLVDKLRSIQRDLAALQEFLSRNKAYIDGLAGPGETALARAATKQEEVALQGEHRALDALVKLIVSVIEGLSFVLVLFEGEGAVAARAAADILLSLPDTQRQRARELTYEQLFTSTPGRDLARELVKAIVNRSIARGANVDSVAEALRRRCGSFCSADDVVVFKAQELLTKAAEAGAATEGGRSLLNESLLLFQQVASALTGEQLKTAVAQYVEMEFFAGAVRLVLRCASMVDRAGQAAAWVRAGMPQADDRQKQFEKRTECYNLIHDIINAVDASVARTRPEHLADPHHPVARRKAEAYEEIHNSTDELFQTNLFDWYVAQGWEERLLDIRSPAVVAYLQSKADERLDHADLLWRYFARYNCFFDAAVVQLKLAKSDAFEIPLSKRIEYLGWAKTNASTGFGISANMGALRSPDSSMLSTLTGPRGASPAGSFAATDSRLSRQELLAEASDLLDMAAVQAELLERVPHHPRLTAENRERAIQMLNGPIRTVESLYHDFADEAGYYDICLVLYKISQYRNQAHIRSTWQCLLEKVVAEREVLGAAERRALERQVQRQRRGGAADAATRINLALWRNRPAPWAALSEQVRALGSRLGMDDAVFPVDMLVPMLERWSVTATTDPTSMLPRGGAAGNNNGGGGALAQLDPNEYPPPPPPPPHWVPTVMFDLGVPPDALYAVYEVLAFADMEPFTSRAGRRLVAANLVYVVCNWVERSEASGEWVCGGPEGQERVAEALREIVGQGWLAGRDGAVGEVRADVLEELVRKVELGGM